MNEINSYVSSYREWAGTQHFMKQLQREYSFPVEVFQIKKSGERELIRVEQ